MKAIHSRILILATVISATLLVPRPALAHCDTMDGPVVNAAKLALQRSDVTPVLKWIKPQDEAQIRAAFARTIKVRALNPEARELADTYFFETLVRVHRAGEGEAYTGLKPAGVKVEPGIALADQALETGSEDSLVKQVTTDIANNLRLRFEHVQEARKNADHSVEAGRAYVAAYVEFIHHVERLQQVASASRGHHEAAAPVIEP